jgi:hypothetical protein
MLIRIFIIITFTLFTALGKSDRRIITLRYDRMQEFNYTLDYRAQCVMKQSDSSTHEDMRIQCAVKGTPSQKGDRFILRLKDVVIQTLFYGDSLQKRLVSSLQSAEYSLALINGCPVVDTLSAFTADGLREWDLLLSFSRLMPEVPIKPVRKGYTWERTEVFKLPTIHRIDMPCQTYRLYTIDRFSPSGDTVFISWRFRYDVEESAMTKHQILRRAPISGKGTGTAAIDMPKGLVVAAQFAFTTPVARFQDCTVFWEEQTKLTATGTRE